MDSAERFLYPRALAFSCIDHHAADRLDVRPRAVLLAAPRVATGAPGMTHDTWHVWSNLKDAERRQDDDGVSARRLASYRGPVGAGYDDGKGRVERVREALDQSKYEAMNRVAARLNGIDALAILGTLTNAAIDIATLLGATVIVGGVLGGIVGSFAGGVGAVPGAAVGAAAGGQIGGWILGFLGLKSLAEDLGEAIPKAYDCYRDGFREAWGPPPRWNRHEPPPSDWHLVARASRSFADGHVIVLTALLSAMAAYLTRSKGDRGLLLEEIRQSPRLGPRVADWVVANEDKLRQHPALKARERPMASALVPEKPPRQAETPSRAWGRRAEEPEHRPPPPMGKAKVPCFKADNLPQGSVPEFDRQLAGQEKGLNDLTVEEYLQGREAYRNRDPQVAREARAEYQEKLEKRFSQELRDTGLSTRDADVKANKMAAEKLKTLAALHTPDLIAGGKDVIGDFGDKRVNSSIGAQWRNRDRIGKLDEAAKSVPPVDRAKVKMNTKLERCK